LNALDWNSVESLESLPDTLEQMGISVPNDELDKYIDLLIESAGAVKEIDVEQLKEAALELANLKKDLESGQ
jgi:nitrate reductase assembly molybdenum cofactor insertion protein NarJ